MNDLKYSMIKLLMIKLKMTRHSENLCVLCVSSI